jgi:ADP-ribose pyrophosphatase YjhB (NUDIX family)
VGLSAAENVVKEIREEAGLTVSVVKLYGVRHKAKHAFKPDVRDFYKFYFLCDAPVDELPKPGVETLDAAYFAMDALPPLSQGRVIDADLQLALHHRLQPDLPAYFD